MKTKAVRLYGKNDLRLEEFELPSIKEGEILARIVSDSLCMSSYKAQNQGSDHKRVPDDVADNPIIIGHEFCGEILEVGKKWASKFKSGDRFSIQPALNYKGSQDAPGYSFQYIGGDATHIVIPEEVMIMDCLLPYEGNAFFMGSLAEPMSCLVGAMHANYHIKQGTYIHEMGIIEGGKMALLAGVGPMGLGLIDYAIHCDRKPGLLVVTDIDKARLERAASIYTVEEAKKNGVELVYLNTSGLDKPVDKLMEISEKSGFDDVFVMAPVKPVVEQGDAILGKDGCLNFFAGPSHTDFSAELNFYDVHYAAHHLVGTSGGNTNDMKESLSMMAMSKINPAAMITHIGGLDSVAETTKNLPNIAGGKKLVYTNVKMDMTAIDDFNEKGKNDSFFKQLADITTRHNGLWSAEAEKYLLENATLI
ncbi:MAG: zinc-binding dehydrogenase [Spirochaetaceae bacterium]|nr:zinc-binding dehydrogenase [Spirochaetaceae bacterium]